MASVNGHKVDVGGVFPSPNVRGPQLTPISYEDAKRLVQSPAFRALRERLAARNGTAPPAAVAAE